MNPPQHLHSSILCPVTAGEKNGLTPFELVVEDGSAGIVVGVKGVEANILPIDASLGEIVGTDTSPPHLHCGTIFIEMKSGGV